MHKRQKGNIGEDIACKFLIKKGFVITERNYAKKWGELDIIAKKSGELHFVEVKSVVLVPNSSPKDYRPEENVHGWKMKQIRKMIETYLFERGGGVNVSFYFHVICVYIDMVKRTGKVKMIENLVI